MLTKRIIIATITILLLIIFVRWGPGFIEARVTDSANPQKAELAKAINTANATIANIPAKNAELPLKLAQLEKQLADQGKTIPNSMDGEVVINSILELATSCDVKAVPLETSDWTSAGDNYLVYTIQIAAKGDYEKIATFVSRMEKELFDNLKLVSVEISGGLVAGTDPDTANLMVAVYTRN
jgi:Tfp pilus assembly protein PilO